MCLAEALLRIPDAATRDRLIRDKISEADWSSHVGASPSLFVNAAAWGLHVTARIVESRSEGTLEQALASLLREGGEPLIRKGVDLAELRRAEDHRRDPGAAGHREDPHPPGSARTRAAALASPWAAAASGLTMPTDHRSSGLSPGAAGPGCARDPLRGVEAA